MLSIFISFSKKETSISTSNQKPILKRIHSHTHTHTQHDMWIDREKKTPECTLIFIFTYRLIRTMKNIKTSLRLTDFNFQTTKTVHTRSFLLNIFTDRHTLTYPYSNDKHIAAIEKIKSNNKNENKRLKPSAHTLTHTWYKATTNKKKNDQHNNNKNCMYRKYAAASPNHFRRFSFLVFFMDVHFKAHYPYQTCKMS